MALDGGSAERARAPAGARRRGAGRGELVRAAEQSPSRERRLRRRWRRTPPAKPRERPSPTDRSSSPPRSTCTSSASGDCLFGGGARAAIWISPAVLGAVRCARPTTPSSAVPTGSVAVIMPSVSAALGVSRWIGARSGQLDQRGTSRRIRADERDRGWHGRDRLSPARGLARSGGGAAGQRLAPRACASGSGRRPPARTFWASAGPSTMGVTWRRSESGVESARLWRYARGWRRCGGNSRLDLCCCRWRLPRSAASRRRGPCSSPPTSLPLPDAVGPVPSPAQVAWQTREMAAFLHFGMNTFTNKEQGDGSESPTLFDPTAFDARQWITALRNGGFREALLTAKHHDGFCLWPTKCTTYSVAASPFQGGQGDVVRQFVDAAHEGNVRVALALSPLDRHDPSYGTPAYLSVFECQLTELLTNYGAVDEIWLWQAPGRARVRLGGHPRPRASASTANAGRARERRPDGDERRAQHRASAPRHARGSPTDQSSVQSPGGAWGPRLHPRRGGLRDSPRLVLARGRGWSGEDGGRARRPLPRYRRSEQLATSERAARHAGAAWPILTSRP